MGITMISVEEEKQELVQPPTSFIHELSASVKSKLRSGIAITSTGQCIEELVLNAVDSGAINIAVRVDLDIFRIQVVDNGEGISESDIKLIGLRYTTSKCHSVEDLKCNLTKYGFRGEALASIIHMSGIVDIVSRYKDSFNTYGKLFTYGQEKSVTQYHTQRPSYGTTVTVQDFMYNMPVRKKIMKEAIDIENIKCQIERIVLILPHISITLRNDKNCQKVLEIQKRRSILERFLEMFGLQHGNSLAAVHYSLDQLEIDGYVSTQPHQTKGLQFIYINKRSVLQTKIHSVMNDLLSHSSIIKNKILPNSALTGPGKMPSSPPKGLRFYGVFVLNIICPRTDYDICLEPKKTLVEFRDWDKVLLCLEELVLKFIKEEGLTLSLDERLRRSEKGVSSDFESPIPHSSQAKLQVFSNPKYNLNNGSFKCNTNRNTITISDVKSAIHGLPVKRGKRLNTEDKVEKEPNNRSETRCVIPYKKTTEVCTDNNGKEIEVSDVKPKDSSISLQAHRRLSSKHSFGNTGSNEDSVGKASNNVKCSSLEAHRKLRYSSHWNALNEKEIVKLSQKIEGKSKLSSLQELKLAHEVCTKEIDQTCCVTPDSKTIPSASLNSSVLYREREKDEAIETDFNRHRKLKHYPNKGGLKNQDLSHALGKRYHQAMQKKKVLKSLHAFKFQKSEEGHASKVEREDIDKNVNLSVINNNTESEQCGDEVAEQRFHFNPVLAMMKGYVSQSNKKLKDINSRDAEQNTSHKNTEEVIPNTKMQVDSQTNINAAKSVKSVENKKISCNLVDHFHGNECKINPPNDVVTKANFCSSLKGCKNSNQFSNSNIIPTKCLPKGLEAINIFKKVCKDDNEKGLYNADDVIEVNNAFKGSSSLLQAHKKPSSEHAFGNYGSKEVYGNTNANEATFSKNAREREANMKCDSKHFGCSNESKEEEIIKLNQRMERKPKLSSLQELRLAYEMCTKEIDQACCVTPDNKTIPSVSPNSSVLCQEREKDDTSEIADNRHRKLKHYSNMEGLKNQDLCHALGKRHQQTVQKKKVLKSLHALKFQKSVEGHSSKVEKENIDKIVNMPVINSNIKSEERGTEVAEPSFHFNPVLSTVEGYIPLSSEKSMDLNTSQIEKIFLHDMGIEEIIKDTEMYDLQTESLSVKATLNCGKGSYNSSCNSKCNHYAKNQNADFVNIHEDCKIYNTEVNNLNVALEEYSYDKSDSAYVMPIIAFSSSPFHNQNIYNHNVSKDCIKSTSSFISEGKGSQTLSAQSSHSKNAPQSQLLEVASDQTDISDKAAGAQNCSLNKLDENYIMQQKVRYVSSFALSAVSESKLCGEVKRSSDLGSLYSNGKRPTNDYLLAVELSREGYLSHNMHNATLKPLEMNFQSVSQAKSPSSKLECSEVCNISKDFLSSDSSIKMSKLPDRSRQSLSEAIKNFNRSSQLCYGGHVLQIPPIYAQQEGSNSSQMNSANNEKVTNIENELLSFTSEQSKDASASGSSSNISQQNEKESVENDFLQTSWKAVPIANGKTIFINLRTGNTSFVPPPQVPTPTEKASQAIGCMPLKIPITDEFDPLRMCNEEGMERSFTHSHCFKAFLPTKRKLSLPKAVETKNRKLWSKHFERLSSETGNNKTIIREQMNLENELFQEKCFKSGPVHDIETTEKEHPSGVSVNEDSLSDTPNKGGKDFPLSLKTSKALDDFLRESQLMDKGLSKWNDDEIKQQNVQDETVNVTTIDSLWLTKPTFAMDAEILCSRTEEADQTSSASAIKSYNIVHPYKFTGEMLKESKVFGQVDKKFIALSLPFKSSSPDLIILVDQHAADERVQLEQVLEQSYELKERSEGGLRKVLRSACVTFPFELSFNAERVRLMKGFREAFLELGLEFTLVNETTVLFHRLPSCLVAQDSNEKYTRRCQTATFIVEATVIEICENIRAFGGIAQPQNADALPFRPLPRPLAHVINTIACKSAVKFGDELSTAECQTLIRRLSECQLPFQCAHGRPSLVPIVDLNYLKVKMQEKTPRPNIKKIMSERKCISTNLENHEAIVV